MNDDNATTTHADFLRHIAEQIEELARDENDASDALYRAAYTLSTDVDVDEKKDPQLAAAYKEIGPAYLRCAATRGNMFALAAAVLRMADKVDAPAAISAPEAAAGTGEAIWRKNRWYARVGTIDGKRKLVPIDVANLPRSAVKRANELAVTIASRTNKGMP